MAMSDITPPYFLYAAHGRFFEPGKRNTQQINLSGQQEALQVHQLEQAEIRRRVKGEQGIEIMPARNNHRTILYLKAQNRNENPIILRPKELDRLVSFAWVLWIKKILENDKGPRLLKRFCRAFQDLQLHALRVYFHELRSLGLYRIQRGHWNFDTRSRL